MIGGTAELNYPYQYLGAGPDSLVQLGYGRQRCFIQAATSHATSMIAVDIACEPEVKVWDIAPLDILIREAGGRFTSLDGTDGPWGGNALASNGHLHDAALSFLGALDDDDTDPDVPRRGPGSVSNLRERQAPPVCGRRSSVNSADSRQTRSTSLRSQPRARARARVWWIWGTSSSGHSRASTSRKCSRVPGRRFSTFDQACVAPAPRISLCAGENR